jgi:predicted RNase H-like HicB family nuclease
VFFLDVSTKVPFEISQIDEKIGGCLISTLRPWLGASAPSASRLHVSVQVATGTGRAAERVIRWADEILENPESTARVSLSSMKTYTAVVERSPETGLFVGFIPGFPGAHTQAESLDELNANLREVLGMLLEDGEPQIEAEFVGTQLVQVG